jgi:hypothetical protein
MGISLSEHVDALGSIKIYGKVVTDIGDATLVSLSKPLVAKVSKPFLAQIRAYSVGSHCVPLPSPILLVVFGDGRELDNDEYCGKKGESEWSVLQFEETISLDFRKGAIFDLLEQASFKSIDGGVSIDNPRIENGKVSATIHIWAKIEVFGAKVSVNEHIPISVPLEGCYTVYEFGFGNVQACVSAAPPKGINLCIKLCVGKWGIEKCWDACTYIGLPLTLGTSNGTGCGCTDK